MDSAMGGRKEPLLLVISTQAATDLATMSQLIDYGLPQAHFLLEIEGRTTQRRSISMHSELCQAELWDRIGS
jgi:hypothetical protein